MLNPNLTFEHAWEDDLMIALQVSASDGFFSGLTQIYTTWEALAEFAEQLQGFPRSTKDILEDTNGAPGG